MKIDGHPASTSRQTTLQMGFCKKGQTVKRVIILALFVLTLSLMPLPTNAGTQDFHFSDFTGDYYLTKDAEGISHLRVVETVTAEFPDFNQNKGICRQIPYSNQDGANITLSRLDKSNISVLRNGAPEPIYSIEKYDGHYEVCTGTDDYVLGTQVYTFEYEFEKVITDYGDYQELYWDTNGNGASQKFDQVTARVHFDDNIKSSYADKQWCYVGKYGEKGQSRCTITELDDGIQFAAANLASYENLTFDIEFSPDSFVVPPPENNYILVAVMVVTGAICVVILIRRVRKYLKESVKAREYKSIFVAPQYQPHDKYGLAEMAEIYLGPKKDSKVGMLLDMIVKHKIVIKKNPEAKKSKQWEIIVKNIASLESEEKTLLKLINGGTAIKDGTTVTIKRQTATSALRALGTELDNQILSKIKQDGLVEGSYHIGDSNFNNSISKVISNIIIYAIFSGFAWLFLVGIAEVIVDFASGYGGRIIGKDIFVNVLTIQFLLVICVCVLLSWLTKRYVNYTSAGLKASKYMEGLKLYIKMAEADRLKFLQSVDGADTSSTGIVNLYEKLLPYAAIFGLEDSWMAEMEQYCKLQEIEEPDYLLAGFTASELSRTMRSAASYATSSTQYTSSSVSGGGGWSSGSSGGGGGGFSGGGGGGGGFGGR